MCLVQETAINHLVILRLVKQQRKKVLSSVLDRRTCWTKRKIYEMLFFFLKKIIIKHDFFFKLRTFRRFLRCCTRRILWFWYNKHRIDPHHKTYSNTADNYHSIKNFQYMYMRHLSNKIFGVYIFIKSSSSSSIHPKYKNILILTHTHSNT